MISLPHAFSMGLRFFFISSPCLGIIAFELARQQVFSTAHSEFCFKIKQHDFASTPCPFSLKLMLRGGADGSNLIPIKNNKKSVSGMKQASNAEGVWSSEDLRRHGMYAPSKERPGGGDYVHEPFLGKEVHVQFEGGTECRGVLKAFDGLGNMVLDETVEHLFENANDPARRVWNGQCRKLGYTIMIGKNVKSIMPVDGFREIPNPFPDHEPNMD